MPWLVARISTLTKHRFVFILNKHSITPTTTLLNSHSSHSTFRPGWGPTSTEQARPHHLRPHPLHHYLPAGVEEHAGVPRTCPVGVGAALRRRRSLAPLTTTCTRPCQHILRLSEAVESELRAPAPVTMSTSTFIRTQTTPLCLWVCSKACIYVSFSFIGTCKVNRSLLKTF
jgi:hypothetical protein